jgi:hypothetical protein
MSDETTEPAVEPDPRFPSGPWTGYFLQTARPGRHRMELHLSWRGGTVSGEGRDFVGEFVIRGTYDTATGNCEWVKQYLGKHAVSYRGASDGKSIRGEWEMVIVYEQRVYLDRGGFRIWPEGAAGADDWALTERATPPAEAEQVPAEPATAV